MMNGIIIKVRKQTFLILFVGEGGFYTFGTIFFCNNFPNFFKKYS